MNNDSKKKAGILRNNAFQTIIASLLCIVIGLLIGYVVLLIINPKGAAGAITAILKNYFYYPSQKAMMKYMGTTLVKASALLMCSLSVLFAYKVGLFNIGAAGQYVVGAGASLYFALKLGMPWYVCMIAAVVIAALLGGISGALKAYFNVNEVISCIMLNWISLYVVNMLLTQVKSESTPYTVDLSSGNKSALLPNCGLDQIFSGNKFVSIGLIISVVMAIVVWVLLEKTKFGFELRATGMNKNAAKYCGMKEKRNTIVTMMIAGGLAGLGAAVFYLSGIETWMVQQTTVPGMGFNGIAAAFLGGLNPIGAIFSSYFIQHITSGGSYVDKTMYCAQISDLISAFIIYLCGFVFFFKLWLNRYLDKRDEKKAAKRRRKIMLLLIQYTLIFASVLILVALGGCFSEHSGVINIGLEGIMVMGALGGALMMKYLPESAPAAVVILLVVLASVLVGMVFSLLLGVAAINFNADQTLVGTALNLLGPAAAVVIVRAINMAENPDNVSSTVAYKVAKKAFLVRIGKFEFSWFMLFALLILIASYIVLYKTRFGLRLMACGEHPQAADSVGINVFKMRYAGVLISGALGGLGGLVYITAGVSEWKFENGVAGFGFLALAVMIFGQWKPVNIGLAALLFGLFRALSNVYTGFDALVALKLPSTLYNMFPYIISLIVLVFVSKNSRAPKAEGIPYDKGQR